jgi:heme exporter protein CcmD
MGAFSMGGYGVYVWSAYGVVLVALAINAVVAWKGLNRLLGKKHNVAIVDDDEQQAQATNL